MTHQFKHFGFISFYGLETPEFIQGRKIRPRVLDHSVWYVS